MIMLILVGPPDLLQPERHHASPSAVLKWRSRPEAWLPPQQGFLAAPDRDAPWPAGSWLGPLPWCACVHLLACQCHLLPCRVKEFWHSTYHSLWHGPQSSKEAAEAQEPCHPLAKPWRPGHCRTRVCSACKLPSLLQGSGQHWRLSNPGQTPLCGCPVLRKPQIVSLSSASGSLRPPGNVYWYFCRIPWVCPWCTSPEEQSSVHPLQPHFFQNNPKWHKQSMT